MLEWSWPFIIEIDGIKLASEEEAAAILYLCEDDDDFELKDRETYCAVHLGMQLFEFQKPVTLVAARYYIEFGKDWIEIGAMDGDFEESARAYSAD